MSSRPKVSDILAARNIQIVINRDGKTLDDVAGDLAPLSPVEHVFKPIVHIGYKLGKSLGLKSSGKKEQSFRHSYELVISALVLSVQKNKLDLQQMLDTEQGAYFEIALPVDLFSGPGTLAFKVVDQENTLTVNVEGEFVIPGQMQAWGKGNGALQDVFRSMTGYLALLSK